MNQNRSVPTALRVVAVLHLIGGVLSAIGMVVRLSRGELHMDLGILGIPIYFGLLRLRSGWRTCALVFAWMGMLGAILAFALGMWAQTPAYFQIFGVKLASLEPWWLAVVSIPLFLLSFWQYRVLVRPDVRSLFQQSTSAASE